MSTTIDDRIILVLRSDGEPYGYYSTLERLTGISAKRWRNLVGGTQKATADMIEAIAKIKPEYAFWIATGITDSVNGHIAPTNALIFPEFLHADQDSSNQYFRKSIELAEKLSHLSKINEKSESERLKAYERVKVFSNFHGSELVDLALEISDSKEYYELRELLIERENERAQLLHKCMPTHSNQTTSKNEHYLDLTIGQDTRTSHLPKNSLFWWRNDVNQNGSK